MRHRDHRDRVRHRGHRDQVRRRDRRDHRVHDRRRGPNRRLRETSASLPGWDAVRPSRCRRGQQADAGDAAGRRFHRPQVRDRGRPEPDVVPSPGWRRTGCFRGAGCRRDDPPGAEKEPSARAPSGWLHELPEPPVQAPQGQPRPAQREPRLPGQQGLRVPWRRAWAQASWARASVRGDRRVPQVRPTPRRLVPGWAGPRMTRRPRQPVRPRRQQPSWALAWVPAGRLRGQQQPERGRQLPSADRRTPS